jgi:hypothetical protein
VRARPRWATPGPLGPRWTVLDLARAALDLMSLEASLWAGRAGAPPRLRATCARVSLVLARWGRPLPLPAARRGGDGGGRR